jgi:hypothetical protein
MENLNRDVIRQIALNLDIKMKEKLIINLIK